MFLKVAVTGFALLIGLPATATTTATPSAKAQRKLSRGPRVTAPASLSAIGRQIPARVPAAGKAAAVTGSSQDLQTASGLTWAEVVARRRQPTGWTVTWADDAGTPRTIDGDGRTGSARVAAGVAPHLQALSMVSDHAGFFRLQQPEFELGHLQTLRDANGEAHVSFQRQIDGIPVWGEDLVFHLAPTGELLSYNGHYSPSDMSIDAASDLPKQRAIEAATDHLTQRLGELKPLGSAARQLLGYDGPTAQRMYLPDSERLELTWFVEIRPNLRDRYRYFIDATDGTVLDWYNATAEDGPTTASALDVLGVVRDLQTYEVGDEFVLLDASRPMFGDSQPDLLNDPRGAILTLDAQAQDLSAAQQIFHVVSTDNQWVDPVSVSAHHNAGVVFQYFLDTHGRSGIDGNGGTMISVVHVTDEGQPMDNAYWNGVFMAFGDGDEVFEPLAGALDVAAHEMTHGVIERTVNLEYRGQSGALNESFADVFAAMVDRDDWLVGEDITRTSFFPTGALRDMAQPSNGGGPHDFFWQPSHMDEFVNLPDSIDNGGVHINSGIPNRACFLIADAIGHEKTERIYYRVLDAGYLNIRSNFQDLRWAVNRAASDLFGEGSPEVAAAEAAFEAVGIGIEGRYEAPAGRPPEEGEEWMVVVNGDGFDTSLYLVRSDFQSDEDIFLVTNTQVFTETGNAVDVAADGSFILFVDAANDLRIINTDGTDEEILSDTGDWSSIALSPDGRLLAATSVFVDTTIFMLDLIDPDNSREIILRGATTQEGIETSVVLFADAMDWDQDSEVLIYDAFNEVPTGTGDSFSYWSVGLLNPQTERTIPLFPPQPEGLHLGNPAFSNTTARHVVFDFYDEDFESNEIWIYDVVSGDAGPIVETPSFAFPTFSADDSELAFEWSPDGETINVARVQLSEDRLSAAADPEDFLFEAQTAKWLLQPTSTSTAVEEVESDALPAALQLAPNSPNPFNPETSISFDIAEPGRVTLKVFDIRGAHVIDLADEMMAAGGYLANWSGVDGAGRSVASGVYLYRLKWVSADGRREQLTRRMALVR
ncbi:MAG: hypothetical protein CME13_23675 [Gemmatimonadetes bacterium]|nr:hypothetical protein [Gemmatimonadota bacterium]HCV25239.1 hypothetical protein [Candidatus Latescibacterota bacterium]